MIASTPLRARSSAAAGIASNAAAKPSGVSERTPTPRGTNVVPGYICRPSGGTLSSANGTTSPMVTSLLMLFPSLFDPDRPGGLHHFAPAYDLAFDVVAELVRRADRRLPAEPREVRPGLGRCHDFFEGGVEPGHDRCR